MDRATLDKDPSDVARMFDGVAARYDLTNDVLSLGQDRLWRKATIAALGCTPGDRVLDIAAGTGTSSEPLADAGVDVVPAVAAVPICPSPRPTLPACRSRTPPSTR